jgi:formamidopyrimidine-DNA glycosylase
MTLQSDIYLISTLGLMGKWSSRGSKHQCMKLSYSNETTTKGQKACSLYFVDQLHYGTFSIINGTKDLEKKLNTIGPSVLEPTELTLERFITICSKHKKKALPEFLMNQKWISGVGNYLKAEIMYQARCSISSPLEDYSRGQLTSLYEACITIAHECTFGKYRLKVYRKRRDPLGNPVYTVKTPDKRTTHWVPNVMPIDIKCDLPASVAVAVPALVKTSLEAADDDCLPDDIEADDLYSISSFDEL